MDHEDVREQLELAAAEPNGIDRLMAGDTPLAGSIAAHLAGCPTCTEELDRLRRAGIMIGDAVRTTPPPELRERTLALVRAVGRDRSPAVPALPVRAPVPATAPTVATHRVAWVAAVAAAVLLAVVATAAVVDRQSDTRVAGYEDQLAGLSHVTATTVAISGEDDAQQVRLEGSDDRWGRVLYSPGTGELAVIARGLTEPAADREYRCWVEVDGERQPVGKMFFGGDLAFWAGPVETLTSLPADATFGVSLVDTTSGSDVGEPPVLEGGVGG
ncbi:MAG TPA: anti-sigma factor [Candidatus Limnocylindrales bacterium]|nr:anti-sigma factor [Candidatus Limnocylindrales bacterium]